MTESNSEMSDETNIQLRQMDSKIQYLRSEIGRIQNELRYAILERRAVEDRLKGNIYV